MTDEECVKFRQWAYSYACKKGRKEEADDFAQAYVEQRLLGRDPWTPHYWIDYLRQYHGEFRSLKGYAKVNAESNIELIHDETQEIKAQNGKRKTGIGRIHPAYIAACIANNPSEDQIINAITLKTAFQYLSTKEQLILSYYLDGHTYEEIAKIYRVTESRICQIIKQIIQTLKKKTTTRRLKRCQKKKLMPPENVASKKAILKASKKAKVQILAE